MTVLRPLVALFALGLIGWGPETQAAEVATSEAAEGDDLGRYTAYIDDSEGVDWAVGVLGGKSAAKGAAGGIIGGGSRGHVMSFDAHHVHLRDYRFNAGLGFTREDAVGDRFAMGFAGGGQTFWGVSSPGPIRIYGASGGGNGEAQLMLHGYRHNRVGLGWGAEVGAALVTEPVVITAAFIADISGMLIIQEPNYLDGSVGARFRVGLGERLYFRTSLARSLFRLTSLDDTQALVGTAFLDVPLGTIAGKARVMIGGDLSGRRVRPTSAGGTTLSSYSPGLFFDEDSEMSVGLHLILEELIRPDERKMALAEAGQ